MFIRTLVRKRWLAREKQEIEDINDVSLVRRYKKDDPHKLHRNEMPELGKN